MASYHYLVPFPLLYESLPTNIVMFGREDDMNNLTKLWLDSKVQFINVYGPPGWGKSTFVIRFGHRIVESGRTNVVYVEMNDCRTLSVLEQHLHEKIPQCKHTQDLPNCIERHFSGHNNGLLIILDNTDDHWFKSEHNRKLENFMEKLQRHSNVVKVIITSRRDLNWKPLDGFVTYTPLKVSNKTCADIFLHKHNDLKLARKVCERLGNTPLPVKLVASRFADSTDLCEEDECIAGWYKFEDAVYFSYKHLQPKTQMCSHLLVLFPGSFTLVAVRAILPGQMGDKEAAECLTSLLKYSFLDRRQYTQSGDAFLVDLNDRLQFHSLIKETILKFLHKFNGSYYSSKDYNALLDEFGSNFFTHYEPCIVKFWKSMDIVWEIGYGPLIGTAEELSTEIESKQKQAIEAQVLSGRYVGMACFAEYVNVNSLFAFLPSNNSRTFQIAIKYSQYKWYSPQLLLTLSPYLSDVFVGEHSILTILEEACLSSDYGGSPKETILAYANLFNSAFVGDFPSPVCPPCEKSGDVIKRMSSCIEKIEELAKVGGSVTVNATAIFYGTLYHLCVCHARECHHEPRCTRVWEYWLKANLAPLYVNFCELCTKAAANRIESSNYTLRMCKSCNSSLSLGLKSFVARDYVNTLSFIKMAVDEDSDEECCNIKKVIAAMVLYSVSHDSHSKECNVQYLRDILPNDVHCLPQIYSHFEPFFTDLNVDKTSMRHVMSNNSKVPAKVIMDCLQEIVDVFGKHYATPRAVVGWAFPNSTVAYDYFNELWNNLTTVTELMDYSNGRLVHRSVPVPVNTFCLLQYDWDSLLCSLVKVAYL